MTAALFYLGQLLACVTGARVATCPLGYFLDGITADGRYDCVRDVPDDAAPFDALVGRAWCAPDEIAIYLSPRRAECRGRINPAS